MKGVVSSYQISLVLSSVCETHPKIYQSRCNFLSVGMLEGGFQASKISIACFKISQAPLFAGHSPSELFVLLIKCQRPDFQITFIPSVMQLRSQVFVSKYIIVELRPCQVRRGFLPIEVSFFNFLINGRQSFPIDRPIILQNNPSLTCVKNPTI